MGIAFQYPDDWTLDDSGVSPGAGSVAVTSPGGAFWSVSCRNGPQTPAESVAEVVKAMQAEYRDLESVEIEELAGGRRLIGYDLAFFCLDLTSTARVRSLRVGRTTYTIFYQAEDREFEKLERVFAAITASLLGSLESG